MMVGFRPIKLQIITLLIGFHLVRSSGILASLPSRGINKRRVTENAKRRNVSGGGSSESKQEKTINKNDPDSPLGQHPFLPTAVAAFDAAPAVIVEIESFFRDRIFPGFCNVREKLVRRIDDCRGDEMESYFCDRILPRARDARERFVQRMEDHRQRKQRDRQEQLKRNEMWRETAEQENATPVASPSSKQTKIGKQSLLSSASSPVRPMSLKTALLPTRVLKLSLVAIFLAETLDRTGALYEDTPEIVKSQIQQFWQDNVLRVYTRIRSGAEGLSNRYLRRWILELRARQNQPKMPRKNGRWRWIVHRPSDGSPVWSTTKVAFAVGTAMGMIATPLLFSCFARIWRPVLVVVGIAETNHYFKTHGRKFVEFLGETPETLGATLDGLLERFRRNFREAIDRMFQSKENTYYEGYSSGRSNSGSVDDRFGDTTMMRLMGGSIGVSWKKKEKTMRSNGDNYSLGISTYRPDADQNPTTSRIPAGEHKGWLFSRGRVMRDFDNSDESTIEIYNHKRITMAKLGLVVGSAIGIVLKGM